MSLAATFSESRSGRRTETDMARSTQSNRRTFLKQFSGAMVGFIGVGSALVTATPAAAAYQPCVRYYCRQYVPTDFCPAPGICFWKCYDPKTLDFCKQFSAPC